MFDLLLPTLASIFSGSGILFLLLGIGLGIVFGVLPGLGGAQVIALLIPVTFTLEPAAAILMMIGAMGATTTAGSITSILINTPGTPGSAATTFDGFPLTRQGKSGLAIGATVTASLLGALISVVILIALLPFGKYAVLAFSFPEYFMLAIMSLTVISSVSEGSYWKGLIASVLGLMAASIGYDPVTGDLRYTLGIPYLYDGINIISVVVGLFAITEIIEIFIQKSTISQEQKQSHIKGLWEGVVACFKHFGLLFRSSLIGTAVGILPGIGGSVANFLSYGHAVQSAKDKEMFGKGDIRGVIAPEASNNAKDGGSLVPMLIFGIPGSVDTAVLLGALIIHGIEPGPLLMINNPEVVVYLILGLVLTNILVSAVIPFITAPLAKVVMIRGTIIAPVVLAIALLGTYVTNGLLGDVVVALIFGVIGFVMKQTGFSRVCLVIAFVLSDLMQTNFHLTMNSFGVSGFFTRPLSLILFIVAVLMLTFPFIKNRLKKRKVSA